MKTRILTLLCMALLSISFVTAQQTYDIRFELDNVDCEKNEVCYRVQLRSSNNADWMLAGQNYRIFYDGSKATYKTGSGLSMLPPNDYSPFTLTANIGNTDASSFGNGILPFDATLGFLNYSIDLMDLASGGIALTGDGEWITTTILCFDVDPETISNPNSCLNLIWARPNLTSSYATAFVEVSQWLGQNATINAEADLYDDLDENDGDGACLTGACGGLASENNDAACSDGLDNDDDGLIDCNDPDCELTMPCSTQEQQFYGVRLALESFDCDTRQACYNVEINSEGRTSFTLGDQRYRLYYNSGLATFVQGVSEMAQDVFSPFTLNENTENTNAGNQGDLAYDNDLGVLDFSINLSGFAASDVEVPTNTFIRTSTICFNLDESVIGNSNTCLEATWARTGTTDGYSSQFIEIDQYINGTTSAVVGGMLYNDLDASDGEASCFITSCSAFENTIAACSDGMDNDNDGLVDCADSDCTTIGACNTPTVRLGDFVFEDLNGNGVMDNGEAGVNGIEISVYLDENRDGVPDNPNNPLSTTISASSGSGSLGEYGFSLSVGSYVLVIGDLNGYTITTPGQGNNSVNSDFNITTGSSGNITLTNGGNRSDVDLGLYKFASLSGIAFNDLNNDGIQQNTDTGINNVIANLYATDDPNTIIATTTTATINGVVGYYEFTGLAPGSYIVELLPGFGFSVTSQNSGNNDNLDSDINPTTGRTETITLQSNQIVDNIYGGYTTTTAVGDFVWNDTNGDGIKGANETGINGITIRLFNANGTLVSNTVTTNDPINNEPGFYKFTGLNPGNYYIEIVLDGGLIVSKPNAISDEERDSDITGSNGSNTSDTFTLSEGEAICDLDAGVYAGASVNGLVWQDEITGSSGVYDVNVDTPLPNILVKLLDSDNQVVAETTTNANGEYNFTGLSVGSYSLMFVSPDGLSFVTANQGGDDDTDSEVVNNEQGTTALFSLGVGQNFTGFNAGLDFETVDVDLIGFTGYWNQDKDINVLNWTTASEINNDLFEVERTLDLTQDFEKIGEVDGVGTSNVINDYAFVDTDIALSGTYYYRLKQMDYNGDFEYSNVIAIDVNRIGKAYVTIKQNPVVNQLGIELFTEDDAVGTIMMYDMNGRIMPKLFDNQSRLTRGNNLITVDADGLTTGQYILVVTIAEERFIKKLIKL